jgi:hypothetical protein
MLTKSLRIELVKTDKKMFLFKLLIQKVENNIIADIAKRLLFLFLFIISFNGSALSQNNLSNERIQYSRLRAVVLVESTVGTFAMVGLHYLWYKKFPHSRFHLFNDNNEWLNMDKAGHATTAYNFSAIQFNTMRWCGLNNRQSNFVGGLTALGVQTIVEIFDGFSQKWGFSTGDMLANITGTALFMAQQSAWKEQRIQLKFSFHKTIFAQYNPNELGKNKWQRWLKDYNGQNYWLSMNPSSFMSHKSDFPKWLNIAFGLGAEGMTGAVINPLKIGNNLIPEFKRKRKYFISADASMLRLFNTTNSTLLSVANIIKLPAPAIEFKKGAATKFDLLFF